MRVLFFISKFLLSASITMTILSVFGLLNIDITWIELFGLTTKISVLVVIFGIIKMYNEQEEI